MRVLIIDDGKAGDDLAHHLKALYGAETFRALTLREGLRKRRSILNLDFVVFDLSYPDSSREESIKCIPELARDGMQVFVFTGYEEKELMQKSLDAGAADWFVKGDNHRGGSALGLRMASLFYRRGGRAVTGQAREKLATGLFEGRKEQAMPIPPEKASWFSTSHAVVTLGILILLQLIALCGFIYSQGGSNALFRKQVGDNTSEISRLVGRTNEMHDQNMKSIEERQELARRINDTDRHYEQLRADQAAGFQKIYDILLTDRKTNADNRQTDQAEHRK
jgi:CheY-like chemotaxis protein